MIATLQRHARFLAVNAQSNSANMGYNLITKYDRADYICIDAPEARLAVSDRTSDIEYVASKLLPSRIDCPRIVVTKGTRVRFTCPPTPKRWSIRSARVTHFSL
jgi:hypothetical protein